MSFFSSRSLREFKGINWHRGCHLADTCRNEATLVAWASNSFGQGLAAESGEANARSKAAVLDLRGMAGEAKLCLYSAYENIELAEKVLFELAHGQVGEETLYWIAMALREALANAIKHGNKLNPEKRVFVHFRWEEERRMWITVEDEGEGFDPEELPDPRSPENLLKDRGRGVFYMRHFMEGVRFRRSPSGGTIVEMYKDDMGGTDERDVP